MAISDGLICSFPAVRRAALRPLTVLSAAGDVQSRREMVATMADPNHGTVTSPWRCTYRADPARSMTISMECADALPYWTQTEHRRIIGTQIEMLFEQISICGVSFKSSWIS